VASVIFLRTFSVLSRFSASAILLALCAACGGRVVPPTSAPATPAATVAVALPAVSGDAPAAPATPTSVGDTPAAQPAATVAVALPAVSGDAATADVQATVSPAPTMAPPTTTPAAVIALPDISGPPPTSAPESTVIPDAEITATIGEHALRLQVVANPETRAQGLMFYRSLPEDMGMLFVFPADAAHTFWMRNTFVPLSVAFLDAERRILNIADMQPLDEQTFHQAAGPARYALEVNQGWFAARGIAPGAVVEFMLPEGLEVR
jgi:uncharacterized membrane protein (UPF0127 family)